MRSGVPILFYESKRSGGRAAIVAAGQIVDATIVSKERVSDELLQRAVVEDLDPLTTSSDVLATSFDSLIRFPNPVTLGSFGNSAPRDRRTFRQQLRCPTPSWRQFSIVDGQLPDASDAIVSIHPDYADAILDGTKTIELRRRSPELANGTRLWIYATRPTAAVVGVATISDVNRAHPRTIWQKHRDGAGVDHASFMESSGSARSR
ncbi:ASCH domain-containing protein [Bradyrhizobium sp. NBAIM01]|uniref:ASCH domain-containing protein n=1 Tax=Bradyrhizobium sp. NBAIM01 TaxID=2793818 RepID=UPI001CD40A19|nr:ASCH domain-containing protein [Bradyrhizobium sp. NBAIM01]MCA1515640.1 ASCH domain-containing protein [Bradyrhizobium sp. NBAIM01]